MSPEIESYLYAKSIHQAETIDGYVNLHIKKRPKWLPNCVWQWLLKQLLVLEHFKSN